MPFILASSSPQRIKLLHQVKRKPFKIVNPNIDETIFPNEGPKDLCCRLALLKAKNIHSKYSKDFILAADTVVSSGKRVLEKTNCKNQAQVFLNFLSGKRHRVYGGIALVGPNIVRVRSVTTQVSFKRLSKEEIRRYLDTEEWKNKAGAYAIQGLASTFIKRINGSYTNVVGLCVYTVESVLGGIKEIKNGDN